MPGLSSRQRIERHMHGQPVDRLPIFGGWLTSVEQYATFAGVSEDEYKADSTTVAMKAYARLHCDGLPSLFLPNPPDYTNNHEAIRAAARRTAAEKYPSPEAVLAYIAALPEPERLAQTFDSQAFYDKWSGSLWDVSSSTAPVQSVGQSALIYPAQAAMSC